MISCRVKSLKRVSLKRVSLRRAGALALGVLVGGAFATGNVAPATAQTGLSPHFPAFAGTIPTLSPFRLFEPLTNFAVDGEVAEIAAVTPDGNTVLYTDSELEEVGFVDIRNPTSPRQLGSFATNGQPTSVAITPDGRHALICVRDPNKLIVLDLQTRTSVRVLDLGGQPDSITISPNGIYAAIAIENERPDERVLLPVSPAGFVTIVDIGRRIGQPVNGTVAGFPLPVAQWKLRDISMTNVPNRFPTDPEPEYVAINRFDQLAVTLQENNFIVIIDLASGTIRSAFSAGTTTNLADLKNDRRISFTDTLLNARLEPDAIAWTLQGQLVTANEGDYNLDLPRGSFSGGRNFTVFSSNGPLLFDCGASLELAAVAQNLYPDNRSNNKGVEPEGAAVAFYGFKQYGFIGAERGNFVGVYDFNNPRAPRLLQLLPTGTGSRPEGLLPIPQRDLFISANEGNGTLSIFRLR